LRPTETNSAKLKRAALALFAHGTIRKAARAIGTDPRNFSRYTTEPEFRRFYDEAIHERIRAAASKLTLNTREAADTLRKVFLDKKATAGARVSACAATIRLCLEATELISLDARISALEKKHDETD
jgi:hypothetical protein